MSITVSCPYCPAKFSVSDNLETVTCAQCHNEFATATHSQRKSSARLQVQSKKSEQESTASKGVSVNPYGAVAVALATLASVSAVLVGVRMVTIVLVILGLLVVAFGFVVRKEERERKDSVWFALGGALNGLVLLLVLFRPAWLNSFWGLDVKTNEPTIQQMIVVPRKQPYADGKLLTADDWVDATNDAIRQGKVVVRIESVKKGLRGNTPCLQVHLQIANFGTEVLPISGFSGDQPALTDSSGRSYAFLKPQKRIYAEGPVASFEDIVDKTFDLKVDCSQDYQLLFEMPSRVDLLKLEVPASAWGREGRCKFEITSLFGDN